MNAKTTNPPSPEDLERLRQRLVAALDPSMLSPSYAKGWSPENPTYGFCSVASEAAWFLLGGKQAGWTAHFARDGQDGTHWWLEHDSGLRFDPTADQYYSQGALPPYERGVKSTPGGFMGIRQDPDSPWGNERRPGKRAQRLLDRILSAAPDARVGISSFRP